MKLAASARRMREVGRVLDGISRGRNGDEVGVFMGGFRGQVSEIGLESGLDLNSII